MPDYIHIISSALHQRMRSETNAYLEQVVASVVVHTSIQGRKKCFMARLCSYIKSETDKILGSQTRKLYYPPILPCSSVLIEIRITVMRNTCSWKLQYMDDKHSVNLGKFGKTRKVVILEINCKKCFSCYVSSLIHGKKQRTYMK